MSLSHAIAAALDKGNSSGMVSADEGDDSIQLDLVASSAVGVECHNLEYRTASRTHWSADDLRAWGDRVAARVTYLMEPLVVAEIDADAAEVQILSKSPTPRGPSRSFYEVRLNATGVLRLVRITFDEPDRRRRTTTFQLTREVLERLADDLAATAA